MVIEPGSNQEKSVHILVGKVLTAPEFADLLEEDPRRALQFIGIEDPTDEMVSAIERRREDLLTLYRTFEGSIDYH
jgi:hypothetical protein